MSRARELTHSIVEGKVDMSKYKLGDVTSFGIKARGITLSITGKSGDANIHIDTITANEQKHLLVELRNAGFSVTGTRIPGLNFQSVVVKHGLNFNVNLFATTVENTLAVIALNSKGKRITDVGKLR